MVDPNGAPAPVDGLNSEAAFSCTKSEKARRHAVSYIAMEIAKEMRLSPRETNGLIAASLLGEGEQSPHVDIARITAFRRWPWCHGEGAFDNAGDVPPAAHILYFAHCIEATMQPGFTATEQKDKLFAAVTMRIGSHFHPEVYAAFAQAARRRTFWGDLMTIFQKEP